MENVGLVLEGGGMRGLYTAGVLEYFMEKDLYFPYVIGVSAGACMAASYLSRQKGRNKKVNIDLVSDPRFLSFQNFIKKREIFGMDFLFNEIPNRIVPFDYPTFTSQKEHFVIGTTDCVTGEAVYFSKAEHGEHILDILRASSSLPFISRPVSLLGRDFLDGGIVAPIPIAKSVQDGNKRNVIIMTKSKGYKKRRSKLSKMTKLILQKKYPRLATQLHMRYQLYNDTVSFIEEEEKKGNCFMIQPSQDLPVGRIERNQKKISALYELGYKDAEDVYSKLVQWLRYSL